MADSAVVVTAGTGTNIDTRTEATNGHHRQVVVLGDPATNAGVAPVDATAGLKVDLGADNDITGTVTANLGATDNAVLDAIEADTTTLAGAVAGTEMQVDIVSAPTLTVNAHAVTNAGTFATQVDGAALTSLQLADDVVATLGTTTYTEAATKGTLIGAVRRDADTTLVDTTNEVAPLQVDANGRLKVEAFSGETLPVSLTSTTVTGTVAVTQSGTWDEVGINDSGNSITVDATNLDIRDIDAATDDITVHGDVGVIDQLDLTNSNPAVVAIVDGDGTQITSFGGGTQYTEDAAAAANPVGTALIGVRADALAGVTTTDGDNVAARMTDKGELYVKHVDAIPVTDNGGVLTVDGTVAVTNAGITTIAGAVSGTEMQVDVLTMPTTTVTATDLDIRNLANTDVVTAELSAVDNAVLDTIDAVLDTIKTDTASIVTATQLIDDAVFTDDTSTHATGTTKGLGIMAVAAPTDTALNANDIGMPGMTANRELYASVTTALPAGTNNIGDVDVASIAAGDNNIGNVDIASIAAGDNNIGNVDIVSGTITTVSTVTNLAQMGGVALLMNTGATGTGSPRVTVAVDSATVAGSASLPAGTNAIGKLAANSGVDIGDVTLTAGTAAIGTILPPDIDVTAHTNYAKKYYTSTGAATDGIIWSPAAGKRWHVVSMIINTSAATTVTLEDDKAGGDEVVMKLDLAANSGVAYNFTEKYPLASGEDAADLMVTTSAGNIYITCVGYEI